VFGIKPEDLEECDLPGEDEILGVTLTEREDVRQFISALTVKKLIGTELDAAVANMLGVEPGAAYSTDWSHGGPVIEREKIEIFHFGCYGKDGEPWEAQIGGDNHYIDQHPGDAMSSGPNPLVAAMRCFVASKFGYDTDVPPCEK